MKIGTISCTRDNIKDIDKSVKIFRYTGVSFVIREGD
jgi:predicted phosphodiesterase